MSTTIELLNVKYTQDFIEMCTELSSFVESETITEFSNAIQNLTGFDWLDNIIPSAEVSIRTYIISIIQNAAL